MSSDYLKIAIIGDFNFTYNSHHATNMAMDHASEFLEIGVNYYWIGLSEFIKMKSGQINQYEGFIVAPGPILNDFFLQGIISRLIDLQVPVFISGEGFKTFLEVVANKNKLSTITNKLVSENLVEGNQFERIQIFPITEGIKKLYETYSTLELTATRYSVYPQLLEVIKEDVLDVEAVNQFEDPEIISLKKHVFFVACGFLPQISSTRERPHPLFYTFLKSCCIDSERTAV